MEIFNYISFADFARAIPQLGLNGWTIIAVDTYRAGFLWLQTRYVVIVIRVPQSRIEFSFGPITTRPLAHTPVSPVLDFRFGPVSSRL